MRGYVCPRSSCNSINLVVQTHRSARVYGCCAPERCFVPRQRLHDFEFVDVPVIHAQTGRHLLGPAQADRPALYIDKYPRALDPR